MTRGIAPALLAAQVRNTAAWAIGGAAVPPWARAIADAEALERSWQSPEARLAYLRLMLAAHHTTVATFVPTDVDTHIRHHFWAAVAGADELRAALAVVDETDLWEVPPVSARTIALPGATGGDVAGGGRLVTGHAGEWLAVRAGAVGRALELGALDVADAGAAAIDAELSHEARALEGRLDEVRRARGRATDGAEPPELDALRVVMTLAHNTGDLSRVVEEWPARGPRADELRARWVKLGHERAERHRGVFALAGALNKRTTMADENHRFLPLRKSRALRQARALLLPIGPFFDGWGEHLATSPVLTAEDRAEVAGILLDAHESAPEKQGYLRALAGLARTIPGGLDRLVATHLPARYRRAVSRGTVRDALRVDGERFAARWAKRLRDALQVPGGNGAGGRADDRA